MHIQPIYHIYRHNAIYSNMCVFVGNISKKQYKQLKNRQLHCFSLFLFCFIAYIKGVRMLLFTLYFAIFRVVRLFQSLIFERPFACPSACPCCTNRFFSLQKWPDHGVYIHARPSVLFICYLNGV